MNPEHLVREHGPRLRALAARLVGEGDADDVVQRAWVAAWKAKPRSPGAWLERVVRRIASHLRRDEAAVRERERIAARPEAGQDATAPLERREAIEALAAGLALLPNQWAEVVLLRYADGLPPREVAKKLALPVETVRSRARRGLAQLRGELERRGTDWRPALALLAAPSPREPAAAVSIGVLSMGTKTVTAVVLVLASVATLSILLFDLWPTALLTSPTPPAREETGTDSLAVSEPIASGLRSVLVEDAPPNSVGSIPGETPGGDARVRVVLTDSELERRVSRFQVRFRADSVDVVKRARIVSTDHGVAESSFPIPLSSPLHLRIELVSPVTPGTVFKEVDLEPDDDLAIELSLPAVAHLHGVVVDTAGRPISGAVVFYGDAITARGDELCPDPFEGRVTGKGAVTEEDGSFVLLGDWPPSGWGWRGEHVTAWHARYSTSTVAASLAARIVLQDRASIIGILLDAGGLGMGGISVILDDGVREVDTGDGGQFVLEDVEAGVHCLSIATIGIYLVEVCPPGDAHVELRVPDQSVTIQLHRGSEPHERSFDGALLGPLGATRALTIQDVSCEDGSLRDVRLVKGLYLLVGLKGEVVQLSIDDTIARADLGTARLVIEGPPGAHVVVIPDRLAGGAVLALATRCAQRIPANGTLAIDPIPEGDYRVGLVGSPDALALVEVWGGQGTVTLPR